MSKDKLVALILSFIGQSKDFPNHTYHGTTIIFELIKLTNYAQQVASNLNSYAKSYDEVVELLKLMVTIQINKYFDRRLIFLLNLVM
jgi:hypothetical protein